MISPSEIRLGNLLTFQTDPQIRAVTLATFKYLQKHGDDNGYNPVPITSDLLERLGIYIANKRKMSHKIRIRNRKETMYVTQNGNLWDIHLNYGEVLVTIQYVHQLQNVYFSITGSDLDFIFSKLS